MGKKRVIQLSDVTIRLRCRECEVEFIAPVNNSSSLYLMDSCPSRTCMGTQPGDRLRLQLVKRLQDAQITGQGDALAVLLELDDE